MSKFPILPIFIILTFLLANSLAFSYIETEKSEEKIELSEILSKGISFGKFTLKAKVHNQSLSFVFEEPTKSFFSHYIMRYEPKDIPMILFDSNGNSMHYYLKLGGNLNESQEDHKNYIIKFKDPPLIEKREELKKEVEKKINEKRKVIARMGIQAVPEDFFKSLEAETNKALENHENKIKLIHKTFKDRVKNITDSIEKNQFKEFHHVFNGITLRLPKSRLNEIKSLPYVAEVYEDMKVEVFLINSTSQINATDVWKLLDESGKNVTGFNVTIAIIDTGIDYTHPDLGNCTKSQFLNKRCSKVIGGYDFVNDDNDPADDHGHGTHCAGIVAGNGTLKGVAPGAKLLAYKVLDSFGYGYESDVIAAIERAINDGADIISMSLGTTGTPDSPLSQAVENAVSSNVVVVVAAGNSGPMYNTIATPANALRSIAVGATHKNNSVADFSSRGPVIWKNQVWLKPDVVAPGVDICSAQPSSYSANQCIDNKHVSLSGTSMAAPHVAGVAALLKQYHKNWSASEIRSAIITSSTDLGYNVLIQGSGIVNALKALNSSILINPCQINSSFIGNVIPVSQIPIRIKNLRPYQISVSLNVENATKEYGGSYNISYLNATNILIQPNSESTVLFTINLTNQGGIFFGKIIIEAEGNNYTVPYIASWLTNLNVSIIKPNTILFPSIYIHDDELESISEAKQFFDFIGPHYTFSAPSNKNITVYAVGDYLDESLTYILMKRVYVPPEGASITLNLLEDSRAFEINATSFNGSQIMIYEFEFGFSTYKRDATPLRIIYISMMEKIGNQIIYLSNKPESPYNTDIILKYDGIPVSEYNNDEYEASDEEYLIGWVLHNINHTTPTTLSYTKNDVAEYIYSHDYPGYEPYMYYDLSALLSPVPNNLTEAGAIFLNRLPVPLNRTYYVMGLNPVPENYKSNWSFFKSMMINYLSFNIYDSILEQYVPIEEMWYSITPAPGAKDYFSFGKAPYKPTSFLVNNSSVKLKDYLIRGYTPKIHLWSTSKSKSLDLIPRYQIFLNNSILIFSGNLTDEKGWNHTRLNYNFESNGTYLINLTIPLGYPVWNITRIEAIFTVPGEDVQPPVLNHIEAKPYFEINKLYSISMNITDNSGIKNVSVEYRINSAWIQLEVQNNSDIYETNLTIDNPVESFDLKISINDTSENQITYIISPLALIGKNISMTLNLDSTNAFKGGIIPVSGTTGIDWLKINFFINNTSVGKAISDFGYYSSYVKLPCDEISTPITAKFFGTGVYMESEVSNYTTINFLPLNFTVSEKVDLGSFSIIDATCPGAYLMINRSEFFYGRHMLSNIFFFYPHHYGNYTITLNTSCGENISRNVFANITSPPRIIDVYLYPKYPVVDDDLLVAVSTYSQDQHNLVGNLSNSSMNIMLDLVFSNIPSKDYQTGELYNYSYCHFCWSTKINKMQLGIYNLSLELSDAINQKDRLDHTIYVYPQANISFNITDSSGKPVNRILIIGFDEDYDVYSYQISGYKKLESLPNVSYFNKSFHIGIKNYNKTDYQLVRFENSTIQSEMSLTSDYFEERKELPDKILYSIYSYKPSWNFSKVYVEFYYSNFSRFNMYNPSRPKIYSCKSYNFAQNKCIGDWVDITRYHYIYQNHLHIEGETDDPQAVAFGEPRVYGTPPAIPTTTAPKIQELFLLTTSTLQTTTIKTTTTIETSLPCPFECCINEANFTDKPCSFGECINNTCVVEEEKKDFEAYLPLIVSASIVFLVVSLFAILNRKNIRATKERIEIKEVSSEKEKRIEIMIRNLSENIERLKSIGYETSRLEKELKLAEIALKNKLPSTALIHIENLNKLLKSIS